MAPWHCSKLGQRSQAFVPPNLQVVDVGYLFGGDVTLEEALPLAEAIPREGLISEPAL